ncbi:NAD(P)H-binding protein [Pedobacter sp. KR3-3]|uniref:NAD(P)H-binding protein n=1 Tax=Pedobacter albus TaxID=3113905 RepID=A0ABU7I2Q1_9SPHI|nr:NAD(P)H-binding protein [Pedobacter sp. KR3-3]MEE1943586.1 NAD(P)H-binding protein [Pedobacter sp. KR3-3]
MKVAVIGATGFVGQNLTAELANRGHQVIAIARNVGSVAQNDQVTAKTADVSDVESLADALKGADVVVSAFNAGWTNPNLYADFIKGSEAVQAAVKTAGVPRLIVIGGAGSLFIDGHQLVDGPDFPAEYKAGATAARDYLNILKNEKEINWTFFSPAIEMHPGIDTGRTGNYRLGLENPVFNAEGRSILSVQDLAVVIADEVASNQHAKQRFTAAY